MSIENTQYLETIVNYSESMHGVCMAIATEQYASLSERMNPVVLNVLMDEYYSTLFPAVKACNGHIFDVIGDTMRALWVKPIADSQLRSDACHAALKIYSATQHFNQSPLHQLPTRIGLYFGEMRLDINTSTVAPHEYQVTGDIVNITTRVQWLNKVLRTRVLVSGNVIDGLHGFISREVGEFLLEDTERPITIFELVSTSDYIDTKLAPLLHAFEKALNLFQNREWLKAQKAFLNTNKYYPNDGPTLFYVQYLQKYAALLHAQDNNTMQKPIIEISHIIELSHIIS